MNFDVEYYRTLFVLYKILQMNVLYNFYIKRIVMEKNL